MFFPNDYQFYVESHCTGEPQIDLIVRLLALLQEAFELEQWASVAPTPVTDSFVRSQVERSYRRTGRDLNMPACLSMLSPNADVRVLITTGAKPLTPTDADSFNILFNGDFKKPDPKYWSQAIELLRPFTAWLAQSKNKNSTATIDRIHRYLRTKPAGCFGLDYYTEPILTNLGGKAHVLATPAHRTSEFLDGVLIELVPGYYLDPNNPEHLTIQAAAMHHLGIDD